MKHRLLTGLAVAPLTLAMLTAGPAGAISSVRVSTLSGAQGWRVSPANAGEVAISGAADDPIRKEGSLRLNNLAGGAGAQAQLPLIAPLAEVAGNRIAYSAFVASGADPQYGVNLQLEISGGTFATTLSYQPHLDGGLSTGMWRTFADRRGAAVWWSSRAFGTIPSNQPVSLADVVAAEGPNAHVVNVYLNVGAALDAYADDVAMNGVRYTFAAASSEQVPQLRLARPVVAAAMTDPEKQAGDSVTMLAGSLVAGAGFAFAGTAMVRRRKDLRR